MPKSGGRCQTLPVLPPCHIATAASALPNITLCFNRTLRQLGAGVRLTDVMYILHNKLNVWKQLETLPIISWYQNKQSGQLARRPQLGQAGVVPGLADPGVILEISETITEVRSCSRLRISRLESGGCQLKSGHVPYLWFADLIRASVLSKSIVTYPRVLFAASKIGHSLKKLFT